MLLPWMYYLLHSLCFWQLSFKHFTSPSFSFHHPLFIYILLYFCSDRNSFRKIDTLFELEMIKMMDDRLSMDDSLKWITKSLIILWVYSFIHSFIRSFIDTKRMDRRKEKKMANGEQKTYVKNICKLSLEYWICMAIVLVSGGLSFNFNMLMLYTRPLILLQNMSQYQNFNCYGVFNEIIRWFTFHHELNLNEPLHLRKRVHILEMLFFFFEKN